MNLPGSIRNIVLLALGALFTLAAVAQTEPYIGYAYPAGARQGTTVRVLIGGQRIGGVNEIAISGKGVRTVFIRYEGAGGPLNRLQEDELKKQLKELTAKFLPPAKVMPPVVPAEVAPVLPPVKLPDLPELRDLDKKNLKELRAVAAKFLDKKKRTKPPIAEDVTVDVTIDADAAPGDRELRVRTGAGFSNPIVFQVSKLSEVSEKDRNEPEALPPLAQDVPVVLNGQIMPGEVDSFPLRLKAGQKLQITASARHLIPYLADAVPGWFQAALALVNEQGDELAYACENGFDPDPSLFYTVPKDGTYFLRIRDSIYRGREDFVYRVAVELQTPADTLFPFQSLTRVLNGMIPTAMYPLTPYVDAQLPQVDDTEPNDTSTAAQKITFPAIVKGKIAQEGDVDIFQFAGKAGDTVVAEIYARRLGSPMDSLLRIFDATGKVIAMNDDNKNPEMGMITNYSDSYLLLKLPATGSYYVQVSDSLRQGGDDYNYYLRISPPQGDFALRMTPSTLNMTPGNPLVFTVYAFRKDGWDGDIDIVLKDAPAGFTISGARIPPGQNQVRMTLIAPPAKAQQQLTLQLEGRATIAGKAISRPVIAAEHKMQAFAYYHLVPEGQLLVLLKRGTARSIISLNQAMGDKLLVPSGGELKVTIPVAKGQGVPNTLSFIDLPAGITTKDVSFTPTSINFTLVADDKHLGYADNLIIEAFVEQDIPATATAKARKSRYSTGIIPAIAYEIVK